MFRNYVHLKLTNVSLAELSRFRKRVGGFWRSSAQPRKASVCTVNISHAYKKVIGGKRINHTSMLIVIAEILGEPLQVWHGIIFQGCCPQRKTLMNKFQRKKFGLFYKSSGESCSCCRCYYRFQQRSGFSSVSARAIYHLVLRRLQVLPPGFTFESRCFHWLPPPQQQQEEKP